MLLPPPPSAGIGVLVLFRCLAEGGALLRTDLTASKSSVSGAKNLLASAWRMRDDYVMRSTQHVAGTGYDMEKGHYSDPPLLVLASLANGPKHGHAMIEDIANMCGTHLGPGTLYGAIARLEQQGWIEPLPPEERRQPYRITDEGLRVLSAKLITLYQFTKAGLKRLEAL